MQSYSYIIPASNAYFTEMSIYNERGQIISIVRKTRHRLMMQVFHSLLRGGMPFCYRTVTKDNKPIYKIDCLFSGIRYTLQNGETLHKVPIKQACIQLIERAQTFVLNGNVYMFEKDYTYVATLKRNETIVATIRNIDNAKVTFTNRIQIEAISDDIASLTAILYQTFVMK